MATGLGLRAQKGGAVAVAVRVEAGVPSLLVSTFLATHEPGDRLSLEPYGSAYDAVKAGSSRTEAAALVEEGRWRQDHFAETNLRALLDPLALPVAAGLLVNRAGWITDLLGHALGWAEHVPVVEGLAVREALRAGLGSCGIAAVELDEKTLPDLAAERLGLPTAGIEAQLKELGVGLKPWRKEQKLAALAGWVAAVSSSSTPAGTPEVEAGGLS